MGFRVWGLGFGVWGLGFRVWGLGSRVSGLGSWACGFRGSLLGSVPACIGFLLNGALKACTPLIYPQR